MPSKQLKPTYLTLQQYGVWLPFCFPWIKNNTFVQSIVHCRTFFLKAAEISGKQEQVYQQKKPTI